MLMLAEAYPQSLETLKCPNFPSKSSFKSTETPPPFPVWEAVVTAAVVVAAVVVVVVVIVVVIVVAVGESFPQEPSRNAQIMITTYTLSNLDESSSYF